MRLGNLIWVSAFLLFLPVVNAAYIEWNDGWGANEGTVKDGVVWGGESLDVGVWDVPASADVICWDWTDNNKWNHCFFRNWWSKWDCDSLALIGEDGQAHVISYFYGGSCDFSNDQCDRPINTGNPGDVWSMTVDAMYILDCGGSNTPVHLPGETTWVVNNHKYDCENGASSDYDYEGYFAGGGTGYVDIKQNIACPSTQDCDEDYDDDPEYTPWAWINDPCRTLDGYGCSANSECLNNNCAGSDQDSYRSHCMTSSYYQVQYSDHYPCCGSECQVPWASYWGNKQCVSGSECDYAIDDAEYSSPGATPNVCRKSDGQSCSSDSECLTGHSCCAGTCAPSCIPDIDVNPKSLTFNVGQ